MRRIPVLVVKALQVLLHTYLPTIPLNHYCFILVETRVKNMLLGS